jgi:AcrR family transcriptional regulator
VPRLVDKKEKAARIGAAAIAVFRKLGYDGTRNKDEILRSEFERYFAAFESGAAAAMAEADSPGGRLLSLVEFAIDHVSAWEDHCAVYVDYFGSAGRDEAAPFSLSDMYAEIENSIRLLIEEGQACGEIESDLDPGATAELLVSVFEGVVLHGVFSERQRTPESLRDAALRLITRSLFTELPESRRAKKNEDDSLEKSA